MRSLLLAVILFTVGSSAAFADGKQLHDAACLQCHASLNHGDPYGFYTSPKRKVKSLAELQKRVKSCAVAADVKWDAKQRQAVVDYLAKTFYHFK